MKNTNSNVAALRNQYRALRDACTRVDAKRFDTLCLYKAHELADGEEVTPFMWVQAAREISDDLAMTADQRAEEAEMMCG